ncbi:MAG: aminotransferase class III-fold pyridoxal phosphate-dependent enzyme, partial [Paracoccus sp. (in: a-proteobacteria)]|nr:aminotransferase class III-fold pyridoxal phosphate-dependent enzyme [Paracoccus sp. (in: a-proteobacteria)]
APAGAPAEPSRFDLNRRAASGSDITPEQQAFIDRLTAEYSAKFPTSKARTQENRRALADPRSAGGFRPEWKELVFPIIAETSKGAYLTDPDGNRFLDLVNGFGQTAFGHAPDFVTSAVSAQLEKGFAIGPQTPLAHEVARKFLTLTGHERVTFCNTGSEAVMAAIRLARTVTGRDTVVTFNGDYHGQFDEVLVRARRAGDPVALPAVAGVPQASVSNMVVLSYGSDEALDWISKNINDIAAVLVEPVQSRNPELRPRAFVEALRDVTARGRAALILDEIVTGFRVAKGGIQELWNIRPDMATYGKVLGGGMPIGVLAGDARFMDALDGGHWAFGDDSRPEVPPTFFAGTFVRHPLVLAAVSAVLDHVGGEGRALYDEIAPRTQALKDRLNGVLQARGLAPAVTGFSSWLIVNLSGLDGRAGLVQALMRMDGVHVLDGYPWFFTTAHQQADFDRVADAFARAIDRLQTVGILAGTGGGPVPLTPPMQEIWMAAQLGGAASDVFIESMSLRLSGALD